MDVRLRELERRAASGDSEVRERLIRERSRSGDPACRIHVQAEESWNAGNIVAALNYCREFLSHCDLNGEDYLLIREFLVSKGVKVLFYHRGEGDDRREVFSLFGVRCSIPDFENGNYKSMSDVYCDFVWDVERFGSFTQQEIATNLQNLEKAGKRDSRVLPSAMYYHWCARFLGLAKDTNLLALVQMEINSARSFLIDDFRTQVLTSTRIFYGSKRIEHLWNMPDSPAKMTVSFELMGTDNYLHYLRTEGRNIARAVLGADETVKVLDDFYSALVDVRNGVFVWRLYESGEQRAVGFGFCIIADFYSGFVRLVSAREISRMK